MSSVIFTHYSELYGANISFLMGLKNNVFDAPFVILPLKGPICIELKKLNVEYIIVKSFPQLNANRRFFFAKQIYNYIISKWILITLRTRGIKPKYIYSNSLAVDIGYTLANSLNIRHFWHVREYGDRDYRLHNLRNAIQLNQRLMNSTVICVSHSIAQNISDNYTGVKCSVLYNASGIKRVRRYRKTLNDSELLQVGIIGYFHPGKGFTDAVDALIRSNLKSRYCLNLAGDNTSYKDNLISWIKANDMVYSDHGYVKNVQDFYDSIDVLIVPSYCEAFGRVTIEGLFNGLLVLGRNTCGTAEILSKVNPALLWDNILELEALLANLVNPEFFNKQRSLLNSCDLSEFSESKYVQGLKKLIT